MRSLFQVSIVALLTDMGVACAVGWVPASADPVETMQPSLEITLLEARGKIAAVRPEKNEVVVSENVKNWTFQMSQGGRVLINDRDSKLADLRPGDDVSVTFDRQGEKLFATAIRCTRN